jgi:teichoic acid transport system permease protein
VSAVAERQRAAADDYTSERHVYEPLRIGIPPLRPYIRALWARRHFAVELARTELRAEHFSTALGQLWLIVNPLLLSFVYFMLMDIVRSHARGPAFLAHIMAGLFAFRLVSTSLGDGARSVVGGGRLILNTAFPRALLPLSAVIEAVIRFLPMVLVYAVAHVAVGLPIGPHLLWVLPILALMIVFAAGVAMLVATLQVYFRDIRHVLRYFTRIWLYSSPILWYVHEAPQHLKPLLALNPLYPMLGALSDVVTGGVEPRASWLLWSLAWAIGAFVVGGLVFVSREREFAVRI